MVLSKRPALPKITEETALPPPVDLLHPTPHLSLDTEGLQLLIDLAFMGRETGTRIDDALALAEPDRRGWSEPLFADDLFIDDFIRSRLTIAVDGRAITVNHGFLRRVFTRPPTEPKEIAFRQEIVAELAADDTLRRNAEVLYRDLQGMIGPFKTPGMSALLDVATFQLTVLKQVHRVIDLMVSGFGEARSGLGRIAEAGRALQASDAYRALSDLLAFEDHMARVRLDIRLGADGWIRHLEVRAIDENSRNPFYLGPVRRLVTRLGLFLRGYRLRRDELIHRLLYEVFLQVAPSLLPLLQLTMHLEFYLTAFTFRQRAAEVGLPTCLPSFAPSCSVKARDLWNPLLLEIVEQPVPAQLEMRSAAAITLLTGPNSGGKTRLLQAIGLAQVLGQSGLFVAAEAAELPIVQGMFVSLIEQEATDQVEGRLGRELMRIRSLFESLRPGSMVIVDELCSGTNPSEGAEVFAMVLQLLRTLEPTAFLSTHFLDFARQLEAEPPIDRLEYLQGEIADGHRPTYQFKPGIADTSLALGTARRLGVTFEELSALVERQVG